MFNPMFKEIDQGRKYPGSCAFAELELLSYRKPKRVVQNEKNGQKVPKIFTTIIMKIKMKQNTVKEIVKGAHDDTQNQNSTPQKQSYRLWWGAADQCTMADGTYSDDMI